jgi:NodT family efflux transporter outer membrane factor (OMF) lipoprotein
MIKKTVISVRSTAILGTISVLLSACAVGPDYQSPALPSFSSLDSKATSRELTSVPNTAGGSAQRIDPTLLVPSQWWSEFQSDALNHLVQIALEKNPSLAAADRTLLAARENANAQYGALFPTIAATGNVARNSYPPATYGQTSGNNNTYNLYGAGVNVSYRLDLTGGVRRQIESALAQADFQKYQLEGAYLSLTSNVVATAIREASQREQYDALAKILESQQDFAKLVAKQFEIGAVSQIDVSSQNTLVANTQSQLLTFEKNLAITQNQLAALLGGYPGSVVAKRLDLKSLQLPKQIPDLVPSNLVAQRPDILAAEALVKSTNAQFGVATANLLPQINLTAGLGTSALLSEMLFGPQATLWTLGAGLTQPLFQGGALVASRRAAKANYEQAALNYEAVVTNAFTEVSNALKALEVSARNLQASAAAEKNAGINLRLVEQQYRFGTANYLAVLNSQTQYQQAKINLINAQADRFAYSAALYAALGGGWWDRAGPASLRVNGQTDSQISQTQLLK